MENAFVRDVFFKFLRLVLCCVPVYVTVCLAVLHFAVWGCGVMEVLHGL